MGRKKNILILLKESVISILRCKILNILEQENSFITYLKLKKTEHNNLTIIKKSKQSKINIRVTKMK